MEKYVCLLPKRVPSFQICTQKYPSTSRILYAQGKYINITLILYIVLVSSVFILSRKLQHCEAFNGINYEIVDHVHFPLKDKLSSTHIQEIYKV